MKLDHDWSGLLFHHGIPLEYAYPGFSTPTAPREENGEVDISMHSAYTWLQKTLGFYPLFVAAGNHQDAIYLTGYHDQWKKRYRGMNRVLFSYKKVPDEAVFNDWMYWSNVILNSYPDYKFTHKEKDHLFHYTWTESDWIKEAVEDPLSVQLVVPRLDLTKAGLISVRNKTTKEELQRRGFTQPIEIRRIPVEI